MVSGRLVWKPCWISTWKERSCTITKCLCRRRCIWLTFLSHFIALIHLMLPHKSGYFLRNSCNKLRLFGGAESKQRSTQYRANTSARSTAAHRGWTGDKSHILYRYKVVLAPAYISRPTTLNWTQDGHSVNCSLRPPTLWPWHLTCGLKITVTPSVFHTRITQFQIHFHLSWEKTW